MKILAIVISVVGPTLILALFACSPKPAVVANPELCDYHKTNPVGFEQLEEDLLAYARYMCVYGGAVEWCEVLESHGQNNINE